MKYSNIILGLVLYLHFVSCPSKAHGNEIPDTDTETESNKEWTLSEGPLHDRVFSLVTSAENSSLDFRAQYAYIEDIGDGRGYTAGIIGFCSGTGDMLEVVRQYIKSKPSGNILEKYLPALEKVNGTDSHEGLGDDFVNDWKTTATDAYMIAAQEKVVNEWYIAPITEAGKTDGIGALGAYIYYDAIVVHGPGTSTDSFGGIRSETMKKVKTPSQGGDEATYLMTFLDVREKIMLKEEAHSDLSRLEAQRKFIREKNFNLLPPLSWTMYGDHFHIDK